MFCGQRDSRRAQIGSFPISLTEYRIRVLPRGSKAEDLFTVFFGLLWFNGITYDLRCSQSEFDDSNGSV